MRDELTRARKDARKPKQADSADLRSWIEAETWLLAEVKSLKGGELRDLSDRLRRQERPAGVIVGSVDDGRAYLVVNLDDSLVARGLDAVEARARDRARTSEAGAAAGPTLAEAGGKNPAGLRDALQAGKKAIADTLK